MVDNDNDDDDDDDDQGDAADVHAVDHDAYLAGLDLGNDGDDDGANAVAARTTAPAVLGKRLLRERKAASAAATAAHAAGFTNAVARRDAAWQRERAVRPPGWRPIHAPGLPEPIEGTTARSR